MASHSDRIAPGDTGSSTRRAPAPEDRQRDAERSRRQLLAAALDEFAAKGFAGARVQDIAARAGLNKHLISYYFGGKEGLYLELQRAWQESEATFTDLDVGLDEVAEQYLRKGLADPRPSRLMIWVGLQDGDQQDSPDESSIEQDLSNLRKRQDRGELAAELDPGAVGLAIMGMIMAPQVLPHMVRRILGVDPGTPEFEDLYADQIRKMVKLLAGPTIEDRASG
jgi:TetR/AcrR family transcriptional regulator